MAKMFARMVQLARKIAEFVRESAAYEWLPDPGAQIEDTLMIVPFRAKDPELNKVLVDRINESGKIFVSGTTWKGEKAVRIAVSNWQADVERDLPVIKEVLLGIAAGAEKPKPQSPDQ
jgi:glutamate/tyrosine decarboxylase-like PLP-dependent enzyme